MERPEMLHKSEREALIMEFKRWAAANNISKHRTDSLILFLCVKKLIDAPAARVFLGDAAGGM